MARLIRFTGENLRSVRHAELVDLADLNLLVGVNGAGKTSMLEGIHLLGTARSFRTRRLEPVLTRGEELLRVVGEVTAGSVKSFMGVERRAGSLLMRAGGQTVQQTSELARLLPLMVIRPESHEVFSGGSEERRRALDWAVFHVEPGYGAVHGRYARALKQRNAALRQGAGSRVLEPWDAELIEAGLAVHQARQTFLGSCKGELAADAEWLTGLDIGLSYRQGWRAGTTLAERIRDGLSSDRERGTTQSGPHRADLAFEVDGVDARTSLSRGEGKRLVFALLLGLTDQVVRKTGNTPVLLVDDLASELDAEARERFVDRVAGLGCQVFISAVEKELVSERHRTAAAVFHVEQGKVARVL